MSPKLRKREHIAELDGLRVVAVFGVIWIHAQKSFMGIDCPSWAGQGVDLFFVLSGFLNTRNLLSDRERGISIWSFVVRRLARIMPAAYLLILLTVLIKGPEDAIFAATYTYNFATVLGKIDTWWFGHYWSLGVEEQFYLVWATSITIFSFTSIRKLAWLFAISCPVISYVGIRLIQSYDVTLVANYEDYAFQQLFTRGWVIWIGCLLAIYEPNLRRYSGSFRNLGVGFTIACLTLCSFFPMLPSRSPTTPLDLSIGVLGLQCGAVALFLFALDEEARKYLLFLRVRWFCWIGTISYGIYLYHGTMLYISGGRIYLAIALSIAVAAASYYWFERPIIRFAHRFA